MNQRLKSIIKLVIGLLIVIGGFPALVNSLLIVVGGAISGSSDSYNLGRAAGSFVGTLAIWIIGLWLLISLRRQRRLGKQTKITTPENTSNS